MVRALILLIAIAGLRGAELPLGKLQPVPAAEAKELLRAVCPRAVVEGKGCASCPAYTDPKWPGTWDLEAVHYGHFAGKEDEAALAMNGCAPHSLQFGGTVLLVRREGRWKMQWSELGLITSRCASVPRKDGRDLLVCETEDMHQGIGDRAVFVADLGRASGERQTGLLGISDNMNTCGENVAETTTSIDPLQSAAYHQIEFDPVAARLRIDVEYGWRPYTRPEMLACREAQGKNKPLPEALAPKAKTYRVEFDFNGDRFRVSPASVGAKRVVETFHLNRRSYVPSLTVGAQYGMLDTCDRAPTVKEGASRIQSRKATCRRGTRGRARHKDRGTVDYQWSCAPRFIAN